MTFTGFFSACFGRLFLFDRIPGKIFWRKIFEKEKGKKERLANSGDFKLGRFFAKNTTARKKIERGVAVHLNVNVRRNRAVEIF